MRRYDEPVTVQRGWVPDVGEGPAQFLWRDRLWQVRSVVAHWVETGEWWRTDGSSQMPVDLLAEREVWRVEARRRHDLIGIFDLRFDTTDGSWQLVGCED
jgi:hypothetical protein